MKEEWMTEDWKMLMQMLPEGWEEKAWELGALVRTRKIKTPGELLRLLLLHAGTGLSLKQTVVRAGQWGLPELTDVGLLKRMRASAQWLRWMCECLCAEQAHSLKCKGLKAGLRMVAVDSSNIQEPGATGSDWRLHYAMELPGLFCTQAQLTDRHGGESLCRYQAGENDLLAGDRGYCREPQIKYAREHGAHVLLRWHSSALPLLNEAGAPVNILGWLKKLGRKAGEQRVRTKYENIELRLCAIAVSKEVAGRERAKLRESARKNGRQVSERSLGLAGYIILVTTLPPEDFSLHSVMTLYRLRWQIELAFKHLKSLLNTGHVPKTDPDSARAWLQAKLLSCLLIEKLLLEAEVFSPWGFILAEQ